MSGFGTAVNGIFLAPIFHAGMPSTTHVFIPTRGAAGDYYMLSPAWAGTNQFVFSIDEPIYIRSFDVIFSIGTADLTTFTAALYKATYANAATVTVATQLAATSLGAAQTTNISIVNTVVATPYFAGPHANQIPGTTDGWDYLELNIVNPGTSVLHIYGAVLYGDLEG